MKRSRTLNTHYNYQLIEGDKKTYFRTSKCIADYMGYCAETIKKKIHNPKQQLRKYKGIHVEIIKVKVPIYEITREIKKIEY